MEGPAIIAQSLSLPAVPDSHGRLWQYHSRSDRHSKIACWAIVFDLLHVSRALPRQAETGEVVFGLNHEMREFTSGRKKKLDVVLCTPRAGGRLPVETFADLARRYSIVLSPAQQSDLDNLPALGQADVGQVRLALEAKAAMTAHIRAIPRLFDELNSSHHTVHATSDNAIAGGFVMINTSPTFVSSDLNKQGSTVPDVVSANQAHGPNRVVDKIAEISRRQRRGSDGFDAVGVLLVQMANDGSAVTAVPGPENGGNIFRYDRMIERLAESYDAQYG